MGSIDSVFSLLVGTTDDNKDFRLHSTINNETFNSRQDKKIFFWDQNKSLAEYLKILNTLLLVDILFDKNKYRNANGKPMVNVSQVS